MINQRKILIIVTLLAVLMSLTLSAALAQDPEQGQTVWTEEELCRRCHGDAAEGGWAGSLAGTEDKQRLGHGAATLAGLRGRERAQSMIFAPMLGGTPGYALI